MTSTLRSQSSQVRVMRVRYEIRWARVPETLALTASALALLAVLAGAL